MIMKKILPLLVLTALLLLGSLMIPIYTAPTNWGSYYGAYASAAAAVVAVALAVWIEWSRELDARAVRGTRLRVAAARLLPNTFSLSTRAGTILQIMNTETTTATALRRSADFWVNHGGNNFTNQLADLSGHFIDLDNNSGELAAKLLSKLVILHVNIEKIHQQIEFMHSFDLSRAENEKSRIAAFTEEVENIADQLSARLSRIAFSK